MPKPQLRAVIFHTGPVLVKVNLPRLHTHLLLLRPRKQTFARDIPGRPESDQYSGITSRLHRRHPRLRRSRPFPRPPRHSVSKSRPAPLRPPHSGPLARNLILPDPQILLPTITAA